MSEILKRPLQPLQGMPLSTLFRVVKRNRFRIDAVFWGRFYYLAAIAAMNSVLRRCETLAFQHRITATQITQAPVFIVGHWRSGTTHLHNLLSVDEGFTCPTAFEAMFPHHFLFSEPMGAHIFNLIAPVKRPMDNLPFRANVPHEDEFALAALSSVSPYMRFLFPITGDDPHGSLDLERSSKADLERWKRSLVYFLKKLTYLEGKRILLKSPPHLGRIRTLLKIFPSARFIHILRNPYAVYGSTRKLWKDCLAYSHLQKITPSEVNAIIFEWYETLFELFERDRKVIPERLLYEMRFEDLEKEPLTELRKIYEALDLPGFDHYRQKVSGYLEKIADYKKNQYVLTSEDRFQVRTRWSRIFKRYGYHK